MESKECEECGKLVTGKNMARHIHRFHVNSEAGNVLLAKVGNRRKSVRGRWGEVENSGERSRAKRRRREDGDGAATEGEKETGKSSQEKKKGVKRTTSKRKRLTERRCQLCDYRGTDECMTRHILNTHVINLMRKNEP